MVEITNKYTRKQVNCSSGDSSKKRSRKTGSNHLPPTSGRPILRLPVRNGRPVDLAAGNSTLSMTWITPLLVTWSQSCTWASPAVKCPSNWRWRETQLPSKVRRRLLANQSPRNPVQQRISSSNTICYVHFLKTQSNPNNIFIHSRLSFGLTGKDHLLENGGRFGGILWNFGQFFLGHLVESDVRSSQNSVGALGAQDVRKASILWKRSNV